LVLQIDRIICRKAPIIPSRADLNPTFGPDILVEYVSKIGHIIDMREGISESRLNPIRPRRSRWLVFGLIMLIAAMLYFRLFKNKMDAFLQSSRQPSSQPTRP